MKTQIRLWPLASLVACGLALAAPRPAEAQTFYVGQIIEVPYIFCPQLFMEPLGQLLSISQYPALYSLLGSNYGGDGKTTFALPYMPPKTLANGATIRNCIAVAGSFPPR